MRESMGFIWTLTTRFERIVIGSGLVALIGSFMPAGGMIEAALVAGPAVAIAGTLAVFGATRLRAGRRGHADAAPAAGRPE